MDKFRFAENCLSAVCLYRGVADSGPLWALRQLCQASGSDFDAACDSWCTFVAQLAGEDKNLSLPDYLFGAVLNDDNPFAAACAGGGFLDTPSQMRQVAKNDLSALCALAGIDPQVLRGQMEERWPDEGKRIALLPVWQSVHVVYKTEPDWGDELIRLSEHYKKEGCGTLAGHPCAQYKNGELRPLIGATLPDADSFLKRDEIEESLKAHFEGDRRPLLIAGEAGTGKTTLAKWVVAEHLPHHKLVWCDDDLDGALDTLAALPGRCALVCDPLTDHHIEQYGKWLDRRGGLPENVHLLATALPDSQLVLDSTWETLKLLPLPQLEFGRWAEEMCEKAGLQIGPDTLRQKLAQWQLQGQGHTPRSLCDFVQTVKGERHNG